MGLEEMMRFFAALVALFAAVAMAADPCSYDDEVARFGTACKDGQRDNVCTSKCRDSICLWNAKMLVNTADSSPCKQRMPKDYESRFPTPASLNTTEDKKNGAREAQLYYAQNCQVELKCDAGLFSNLKLN